MRGVGVHVQTLETAFDHAVAQCCIPLDRLRLRFIHALGPLGLKLVRNQELRVAVTGVMVIGVALFFCLTVPLWQLALGPILFGVAHLLADFRYCVARPGFHRRPALVMACGLPMIAMALGASLAVGLLAVVAGFLLANGALWKRLLGAAVAGAAALIVHIYGYTADLVFAHIHNIVAIVAWWGWRGRTQRMHWWVLALFAAAWMALMGGVFDPIYQHLWTTQWGPAGLGMEQHRRVFGMGYDGIWGVRLVLAFALAQSVHYFMWIRMVPEEARGRPTPRTFRATWKDVKMEMGGWVLIGTFVTGLALAIWALFDLVEARANYLQFIRFHGVLEFAAIAVVCVEGRAVFQKPAQP